MQLFHTCFGKLLFITTIAELGVLTWTQMETENFETNQLLNSIKAGRGYNYEVGSVPPLTSEKLAKVSFT